MNMIEQGKRFVQSLIRFRIVLVGYAAVYWYQG